MRDRVYLDYNATAPLRAEAKAAMHEAMDVVGNPSSVHSEGRAAKAMVEKARGQIAAAVGCKREEIVFTSGATEAARVLSAWRDQGVEVDPTAHDAVWAHHSPSLSPAVRAYGLANSETGVLTVPESGVGLTFLDVTQAVGRVPFSFSWSGADLAVLSAHKLGGPKGVGALLVKQGLDIAALAEGGGQEMGRRSGTENIIGIAGFGAAAEAAQRDLETGVWARAKKLRIILESAIEDSPAAPIIVGQEADRLPNTSCIIAPGWKGETQVMAMDLAGFAISAGSACSSGKVKTSRVLTAMGFGQMHASSAIRVSLRPDTTEDEVMRFAQAWTSQYAKYRARAA
ncbi:MAG: aminotransferase class V-fold PLP-dependent enzyme [Pseudomonadota bacterium]